MTQFDLITKIMLLPPEEIEKEAKKASDYAKCWNDALEFAMNTERKPNFSNWYEQHEKELH